MCMGCECVPEGGQDNTQPCCAVLFKGLWKVDSLPASSILGKKGPAGPNHTK